MYIFYECDTCKKTNQLKLHTLYYYLSYMFQTKIKLVKNIKEKPKNKYYCLLFDKFINRSR